MKYIYTKSLIVLLLLFSVISASAQIAGNWKAVGPVKFPINVSGQIHGIGRTVQMKFHHTNPQKIYAVTATGGLFISNDGATTWNTTGTDKLFRTNTASICIDHTNDQVLYLGTGDPNYYSQWYGIYKSTNGGATWFASNTGIGNRMAVDIIMSPSDRNVLIAATNDGIWKSTDAGANWSVKKTGGTFTQMISKPGDPNTMYAATHTQFWRSSDMGNTWTQISLPGSGFQNGGRIGVTKANPNVVYVTYVGDFNGGTSTPVLKSTNSGQSFSVVKSAGQPNLNGYSGTEGGQGNYNYGITVDPNNENTVYIVGHVVWKSTNGGSSWSQLTQWYAKVHTDMHEIVISPYDNTKIYNINDGGVWLSTDGGNNWTPKSDGLECTEIYHASQSPIRKDLIDIGTQDNGELHYINNTWYTNGGGDYGGKTAFDYQNATDVYHLNDAGSRKRLSGSGGAASFPFPFTHADGNGNDVEIDFNELQKNSAFVSYTDVYRTTNLSSGPPTWTKISSFNTQVKGLASSPADMNLLYAVTNNGRVYRCDNALAASPTFTNLAAPASTNVRASIAPIKNNPNVVYISCGAKVYRSGDKGVTWADVSSGLPNVNILKIFHDKYSTDESVYVGMATGVYYKNNTMSSWINYSNGLPTIANINEVMLYNDGTANSEIRVGYFGRGVFGSSLFNNANSYVTITAPINGAIVTPGSNLTITASVTPGTGKTISKVEFYNGGASPIGTSTTNPYTITWNNVPAGQYTLTAKAYETSGTIVTSGPVTINVSPIGTTVFQDCDFGGSFVGLVAGDYTLSQLQALGVNNDDISSVRVQSGYQVILYADDNFMGSTVTITADDNCLVDNGFNDVPSSLKVISLNTPPAVSITSPVNNATFTAPANITINANASDAGGSITKVEFYSNTSTTPLSTDATSPYSFSWNNVAAGTYTITAKAYDNLGATASASISITVTAANQAPTVSITAPANNSTYIATSNVSITATAADADGIISKVEFFRDGTNLLGTSTTSPYTISWNNVAAGTYQVTAKATDNSGATTTSTAITIIVTPLRNADNPANTVSGLDYKYYEGNWSALPNFATLTPVKSGISTTGFDLSYRNRNDQFAFSYTGFVNVPTDGIYTFYTSSDDGSNLLIGNTVIVNNDGLHGVVEKSGTIGLKAGKHSITANFFEQGGGEVMDVSYQGPGVAKQFIPNSSLFRVLPANQAPTVSITAPVNNAAYISPATVNIQASASDADGTISKVEFYVGNSTTPIGTSTTAPYTFSWSNVAAGNYSITAKAFDNLGAFTVSSSVAISVSQGIGTIYQHCNYGGYAVNLAVGSYTTAQLVALGALNNDLSSVKVQNGYQITLYADDNFMGTTLVITADNPCVVSNNFNDITSSIKVGTVVPNNAPTVSITSPANNATFTAPATIALTVNAADSDGTIAKVEYYLGASSTPFATVTSSPFSYNWTNVAAGTFGVTAKAYDDKGATATASITVIVTQPANNAPTVSITSPANNATFTAPASITLTANAADNDGTIAKVEYFQGSSSTPFATVTTSPYTFNWTNVAAGTYAITAKATDDKGATASASITVVVTQPANNPPTVSISSPLNNATFTAPASIGITANASDNDGSISKVELFIGSSTTPITTITSSPYTYTWTNVAAGTYTITAKATDDKGATASASISVVVNQPVNNPPTVSITSPGNNSSFSAPATVTISANASDDGSVTKVEFYSGTSTTPLTSVTASPYTYNWTNVAAGSYTITAKAYDNNGATATTSVSITVNASNTCATVASYVENGGYNDGSIVQNVNNKYKCKPWPYSGWCNGAAWAYAPGTGAYWTDAWDLVGPCNTSPSMPSMNAINSTDALAFKGVPNPIDKAGKLSFHLADNSKVSIVIIDVNGIKVAEVFNGNLDAGSHEIDFTNPGLKDGTYVFRLITDTKVETTKLTVVSRPKAAK